MRVLVGVVCLVTLFVPLMWCAPIPLYSNTFNTNQIGVTTLNNNNVQWVTTTGGHNGVYQANDPSGGGVVFSGPTISSTPFTIRVVTYVNSPQPANGNGYNRIFEMTSAPTGQNQIAIIQNIQNSGDLIVCFRGNPFNTASVLHIYYGLWTQLANDWHDIVMVVTDVTQSDGSGIRLYVDGSLVTQSSNFGIFSYTNPTQAFNSGVQRDISLGLSTFGGDDAFGGAWDEFEIWSSALSGSDIATIHANDAAAQGDPVISGLQGQSFQYHGLPNEIFNLITSPHLHINSRFVYLDKSPSGRCTYNTTTCWSHPGTYLKEIGFIFPEHRVHVIGHIHSRGLSVLVDGVTQKVIHNSMILTSNNDTIITRMMGYDTFQFISPLFDITVINSDGFVNTIVSLKDNGIRQAGAKPYAFRHTRMKDESMNSPIYPDIPIHGLIGQTWRNAVYGPARTPYEGDKDSYLVSSGDLFGTDSEFSYYQH